VAATYTSNDADGQRLKNKIEAKPGDSEMRYDPLADMVMRRWWDACMWMQSQCITDCSIIELLHRCYRQRAGVYDPEDAALLDGIDVYLPLTDMKAMAAEAWMRDMMMGAIDLPWTVEPTPIPELPARLRMKVLRDLKMEIAQQVAGDPLIAARALGDLPEQAQQLAFGTMISNYPGDLQKTARDLKDSQRVIAMSEAVRAAKNMERLMRDQTIQMNFDKTMLSFFHDMVTYPAAILKGPILTKRPLFEWRGNRRVQVIKDTLDAYRVSPFDFKPSPDSPDTQRGTFVLERFRLTKRALAAARGQKYWINEGIDAVLRMYARGTVNWLTENMDANPEIDRRLTSLADDMTIDAIDHYGIVSGRELRPYGFSADEKEFYEARVVMCGYQTLAVRVVGEANSQMRPYHSTSYEKMGEQFWNQCPVMKLRTIQRSANAALRSQIRNMAFSSGPMAEIDLSRVQRFVSKLEDLTRIEPFQARLVDPDMMNGGRPAYQFTNVPATMVPLLKTIEYYMKLADDVSNIPSYAQGETGLQGAGRTFRGFAAVFAQALKVFKMPVQNMDVDLFQPFSEMLYNYNMENSTDDSVKGDAKTYARGAQGLVEREMAEQKSLETMQIVAQMAPAFIQVAPAEAQKALKYVMGKALQAMGVPIESFGLNPDLAAALTEETNAPTNSGAQTPIPGIGATPSPDAGPGGGSPQPVAVPGAA
jgi:hypothetical protein